MRNVIDHILSIIIWQLKHFCKFFCQVILSSIIKLDCVSFKKQNYTVKALIKYYISYKIILKDAKNIVIFIQLIYK